VFTITLCHQLASGDFTDARRRNTPIYIGVLDRRAQKNSARERRSF
jgi:hypothetical protein